MAPEAITGRVEGMTCANCVRTLERAVGRVPGVQEVRVNLATEAMKATFDASQAGAQDIEAAVRKAGYRLVLPPASSQGGSPPATGATGATALLPPTPATPGPEAGPMADVSAVAPLDPPDAATRDRVRRFWGSALFTVPLFALSMGTMLLGFHPAWQSRVELLLALPVMTWAARPFYEGAWRALCNRTANMDTLVTLGAGSAFVFSTVEVLFPASFPGHFIYFETGAVIVTLILLGKVLEARSKSRASHAIRRLVEMGAKTARVRRGDAWVEVDAAEVRVGEVMLVKPGERIPTDGRVLRGASNLDEGMVTGESMPVAKQEGDAVVGATILLDGTLEVEATRVGADTMLAQIVRLVDDAQTSRAPVERLVDRVSRVFVPAVIAISLLTGIAWATVGADLLLSLGYDPITFAMLASIGVLIIACPCALGLATPTAIMVGTGRGAERGILLKGGDVLERARRIGVVLLDKTGTLTEGRPSVTDVVPREGVAPRDLLASAAAVEALSEHPLAKAVVQRAEAEGAAIPEASGFRSEAGQGVQAVVHGQAVKVGRLSHVLGPTTGPDADPGGRHAGDATMRDAAMRDAAARLERDGRTVVAVAREGELLGLLGIADAIKPDSRDAVARLQRMGLEVVMVTGDNRGSAEAVARQVGIARVEAGVLPGDKAALVRRYQQDGRHVAMVGDGVNDAPALAQADLGIAMGRGTDIAIEAGHVVLVKDDLRDVAHAIDLSRKTLRKIWQNLGWAFGYNTLLIPVAAGLLFAFPLLGGRVMLEPMHAAAAMALSSVSVVLNSTLLTRWQGAGEAAGRPASRRRAGRTGARTPRRTTG